MFLQHPSRRSRARIAFAVFLCLASPVVTARPSPAATTGGTATVTLQDGLNGYSGASDSGQNGVLKLMDDRKSTDPRYPNPGYRRSIRFDGLKAAIPGSGIRIVSAELSLRYFDEWWSLNVYHIALQRSLDGSLDHAAPAPEDTILLYGDRFPEAQKTPRPSWVTWKLRPETVQSWLDNPASNHGLVLRVALRDHSRGDAGNYGVSFRACSYGSPAQRPRLTITYHYNGSLPPGSPVWDFNYQGAVVGEAHYLRWNLPAGSGNLPCDVEYLPPGGHWKLLAADVKRPPLLWKTAALPPGPGYRLRVRARGPDGTASQWVETPAFSLVRRDVAFQVGVCTSMEKVRRDVPFNGGFTSPAALELPQNATGSVQLVVANVNRDLQGLTARASDLRSARGIIPAADITVRQVGYVTTRPTDRYNALYSGLWPDSLLELPSVNVPAGKVQPLWVTVRVPDGAAPGLYHGVVTLTAQGVSPVKTPLNVTVWDFALPAVRRFRAMALDGLSSRPVFDRLLENGISPAYALRGWSWNGPSPPVVFKNGKWDFSAVDSIGAYCMARGMNAFTMASFPKPGKYGFPDSYSADYRRRFGQFLKAYAAHLRAKGWLKMAQVYNIDEAPQKDWEMCRANYQQVKAAVPDVRVTQCLNEPRGVQKLAGSVDTWDVNIGQFWQGAVPQRMRAGDDAIWCVCAWPSTHPNLFIDYPAIDARIIGWLSWKDGLTGFEYWSATSWGDNLKQLGRKPYISRIESPWKAATFGQYNGDGYLLYPGPNGTVLSSIRLENLRDGFQDYEMLSLLKDGVDDAQRHGADVSIPEKLLAIDDTVCTKDLKYTAQPAVLLAARRQIATWIVRLNQFKPGH
ncbi:MAG TPA: glycoside hydrolase domain-containing protein [Armatimonadota bacterium]|nr:glycoside hydrolase domain-containing protein [Armatimonadota bacterium]